MNNKIAWIQGLRGLLCLWVVLFHYTSRYEQLFDVRPYFSFENGGSVGVACFFIFSGYFCLKTLDKYFQNKNVWLLNKYLRLWPAYFVSVFISFIIVKSIGLSGRDQFTFLDLIKDIPMLPYLSGNIENACWYVMSLMKYYLLIFIIGRYNVLEKDFFYIFIILGFSITVILPDHILSKLIRTALGYLPLYMGMLLYSIERKCSWLRFGLYIIYTIYLSSTIHWLYMSVFCIVIPLLLKDKHTLFLKDILSTRILLYLGTISYPWYLIHQNVGYVVMNVINKNFYSIHYFSPLIAVLVTMVLAIIINNIANRLSNKLHELFTKRQILH